MLSCRYFPECQRCNDVGDSWIPCTGGADGIQCDAYEPMPDVGALLALAAGMEKKAKENEGCEDLVSAWYMADVLHDAAMEIRDACGMEEEP